VGCWLFFRGGECECIASVHPIPSVRGEEPHSTGGDPVHVEKNSSKGVNIEK
jgi:hypothetical protein